MTIGDKIRLHRKALGLTQTELGEKLGVKTNAVSKWECGRVDDIPTSKIKAMAKLFDVQPSYLIDEKQPAPTNEDELNAEDKKLLMMIHNLTPENRERIVAIIEALAGLEEQAPAFPGTGNAMPTGSQVLSWDAPFYLKPRPAEAGPGKGEWAYENDRPI